MGLVSGSIKNIFGGVSQAPAEQRSSSQFAEQINALPILGKQLGRRPPTLHAAKLTSDDLSGAFAHRLGEYTILVLNGVVRVFDTDSGVEQTVVMNVTWPYLVGGVLKAVTIGDTAFLLNTSKVTAKGGAVAPDAPKGAHIRVMAGDYETTYRVTVGPTSYSHTTPAATAPGARAAITTEAIATALQSLITPGFTTNADGFDVQGLGSVLFIDRPDNADFAIACSDGLADSGLKLIKDTTAQFSDLPNIGWAGTIVQIVGEPGTGVDNYFVKCVDPYGISVVGTTWKEVVAPGEEFVLDNNTMPVRVVKTGPSEFTVEACPWVDRASGDDTTNPFPSFIGSALEDIFIYDGRLGFLSNDKIVLSRSGDYYNLFRETVTQILANDPIDVTGSISGLRRADWAMAWNEALYIFADGKAQYVLAGDQNGLTSSTVSLRKVSDYRYDPAVRPVAAGQRVFFVALKSERPAVMEYHLKGYQKIHVAVDVSLHVPTYFNGTSRALAVDDAEGLLLFLTDECLYCYNYRTNADEERLQSAWGKWTFGSGDTLAITLDDGVVNMIQAYTDGTCLNLIILDPEQLLIYEGFLAWDGGYDFDAVIFYDGGPDATENTVRPAHLDRYVDTNGDLVAVWDGTYTVWTLPYATAMDGSEGVIGVTGENPGVLLATTQLSATTVRALGNYTGSTTRAGVRYNTTERLSTLFPRSRDSDNAELRGRLQLRWLRVQYLDAVNLTVTVSSTGRADRVYTVTSTYPKNGELLVPVGLRNLEAIITINAGTAGADAITSLSWEGTYHARAALR